MNISPVDMQVMGAGMQQLQTTTHRPQTVVGQRQAGPEEPRPVEIMSKTRVAGKIQYHIRYTDGKVYNWDWVNRPLLDDYEAKRRSQQSLQMQTWSNRHNCNMHHY